MTENEITLINMIRAQSDMESALMTAVKIIISYLEQHESFGEPSVAYLPEPT